MPTPEVEVTREVEMLLVPEPVMKAVLALWLSLRQHLRLAG